MFFAITGITNSALDIIITIALILTTLAILVFGILYIKKHIADDKGVNLNKLLIIVLVLAFLIRVLLSFAVIGHRRELYETIYATLKDPDYYLDTTESPSKRLYPLAYYLISFFSSAFLKTNASYDSVVANLFIKMPFIIADVLTAYLIYRIAKKFTNEHVSIALCAIVALCPIFLFASSLWGSLICLLLPLFLGVFICIIEKKNAIAIFLSSLALIVAKEGMLILPVVFVYYAVVWVKSLLNVKNNNPQEIKNLFIIPVTSIISLIFVYLISIPYTGPIVGKSFADFVQLFFIYPVKNNWYFATNSLSIFSVFGFNANSDQIILNQNTSQAVFNQFAIGIVLAIFIAVITGCVYLAKRNRGLVVVIGTFAVYTICTYFVGFTALSILTALPLLLLSFVITKDKRFIFSFSVTALLLIILVGVIYIRAGYYNTLPIDRFAYSEVYTGLTALLDEGAFKMVLIVLSILSVLNHICLTLTTFDIAINNRILTFSNANDKTTKSGAKQISAKK